MNVQIQNVLRQLIGTKDTVSVTILAKRSSLIHQNKDVSQTTLSFESTTTEANFSVNFPLRRTVHNWNVVHCRISKWFQLARHLSQTVTFIQQQQQQQQFIYLPHKVTYITQHKFS